MAVSFTGAHFPKDIILDAVFFYVRYGVSYRDLEEIMAERGLTVDHATLNSWVGRYANLIAEDAHRRRQPADRSWRMDETYIRVRGNWVYLYRSVDKFKKLRFHAVEAPEQASSHQVLSPYYGEQWPSPEIIIDKSAANTNAIKDINRMLKRFGCPIPIEMVKMKYLNNLVE